MKQVFLSAVLALSACTPVVGEIVGDDAGGPVAASAAPSSTSTISGYDHTVTASKFKTGGGVENVVGGGFTRWVGTDGVFAVNDFNRSAAGVPNAGAPFVAFQGGIAEHEAAVRTYFVGAGLPVDQIGAIRTNVTSLGDTEFGAPQVPTEVRFSSVLTRVVGGVPVAESHAWARLDGNGDVVAENVYWPALDASVVSNAAALTRTVATPSASAAFIAKLAAKANVTEAGQVVIHHSLETATTGFVAVASYDLHVHLADGTMYLRHFDANADELSLPHEQMPQVTGAVQ